jgi:ATP-dependent Clp protease protease subunit
MKNKKFWNWKSRKTLNQANEEVAERVLELHGTIAEESWFDDDVTPQLFKDELNAGSGDITVWINSPGGDCVAAAQIYNMLTQYKGNVTVKIDGIAASAASVIAMAGNTVLMSPVSMMMIHNPATFAFGDHAEMQKAIDMLAEVKESIINAYVIKTGLTRAKLSHLMDAETWMDANKAVELGFADDIITRAETKPNTEDPDEEDEDESIEEEEKKVPANSMLFSRKAVNNALINKLEKHYVQPEKTVTKQAEITAPASNGTPAKEIKERLDFIKKFI